ncbi:MAG TPA: DUF5668 domain-containing protein, partial [Chloroflexota bacterium]
MIWPTLLILAGVVFLLQNFGLLSSQLWASVWRLWPLVLVLIGLELFLGGGGRGLFGFAIAGLLVLAVTAAIAAGVFSHWGGASPSQAEAGETLTQDLQGASTALVIVRFGAGNLDVGPLPNENSKLAEMTYNGSANLRPEGSYRVRNGQGELTYKLRGGSPRLPFSNPSSEGSPAMDLLLSPAVPLKMDVQEGASGGTLDLSQLHVSDLQLQTGASHLTVLLPQSAGATTAEIKGGASTIDIGIPQGVAANIQYEGGLS